MTTPRFVVRPSAFGFFWRSTALRRAVGVDSKLGRGSWAGIVGVSRRPIVFFALLVAISALAYVPLALGYLQIWRARSLEKTVGWWRRIPHNACCWFGWDVARTGIYFLNLDFPPNGRIEFFALPTASPPQSSLSTSPSLSLVV
jgi:hypothetical protein